MRNQVFTVMAAGLLLLSASVAASAADPNLVSWWKFNETSGTVASDSAGSNNGQLVNGPVWTTGHNGGALSFDGYNDYVQVANNASLNITNAITVSAWINRDVMGVRGDVVSKITPSYPYGAFQLYVGAANEVGFALDIDGFWNGAVGGAIDAGNWHQLTGTYDGTQIALYIDGKLVVSEIDPGTIGVDNQNLYIGRATPGFETGYFFDGSIDDVRIYNRALSSGEVQQLYNIPEPATIALFCLGIAALRNRRKNS